MPTSEIIKKKQVFDKMTSNGKDYPVKKLEIEVFGYNHKKVADDLYNTLKESGFLKKHPLFRVRVDTINGYDLNFIDEKEEKIKYIQKVIQEWGQFKINEVEGEECPVFSQSGKNSHWLIEEVDYYGITISHYVNERYIESTDMEWKVLINDIIDEVCQIVENYEAEQLKTEKRISN